MDRKIIKERVSSIDPYEFLTGSYDEVIVNLQKEVDDSIVRYNDKYEIHDVVLKFNVRYDEPEWTLYIERYETDAEIENKKKAVEKRRIAAENRKKAMEEKKAALEAKKRDSEYQEYLRLKEKFDE